MFCLSDYKQLSFIDQVSELKNLSFQQPLKFLKLLKDNFDLNSFIPETFTRHYYSNLGCNRDFDLSSILAALLIEHFFHIPTISLLCIFLPSHRISVNFDDLTIRFSMRPSSADLKPPSKKISPTSLTLWFHISWIFAAVSTRSS